MAKLTQVLSDEHQNILKVIKAIKKECRAIEDGKPVDREFFSKAIDFIRNYADKFHHAKEEDILFKALCGDSVEMHCNPTEQMLHEHELGRQYIKDLESAVGAGDSQKAVFNAMGYGQLLEDHIFKEDNILYPMAEEVLPQPAQEQLADDFIRAEKENFGPEIKEKYSAIVDEFEAR